MTFISVAASLQEMRRGKLLWRRFVVYRRGDETHLPLCHAQVVGRDGTQALGAQPDKNECLFPSQFDMINFTPTWLAEQSCETLAAVKYCSVEGVI